MELEEGMKLGRGMEWNWREEEWNGIGNELKWVDIYSVKRLKK